MFHISACLLWVHIISFYYSFSFLFFLSFNKLWGLWTLNCVRKQSLDVPVAAGETGHLLLLYVSYLLTSPGPRYWPTFILAVLAESYDGLQKKKVNMLLRIDLCTLPAADKAISQHDRIRCASWCRRKKQRAIKDYCCCASEDDRCLIFSSSSNNTHYHYKLRQWFHTNTSTNILICVLHTNTNTVLLWVQ